MLENTLALRPPLKKWGKCLKNRALAVCTTRISLMTSRGALGDLPNDRSADHVKHSTILLFETVLACFHQNLIINSFHQFMDLENILGI